MGKKKQVANKQQQKIIPIQMDATFFFERAVRSLDRYHYDKALKYFRRAVEYEPENPVNHCNLAGILSEIGQYEESNSVLEHIIGDVDPTMTECYFYMSNNYANMEDYESAEVALIQYLEEDASGQFLEEAGEMMELLSFELDRAPDLKNIKSRDDLFQHDRARTLLEEGKFGEAVQVLEQITKNHPDFLAAFNNLALAYFYMGHYEKSADTIDAVLEQEPGNIHALCNMAIFHQHFNQTKPMAKVLSLLKKMKPFQQDQLFKLATTMGILGEHDSAYELFKQLVKIGYADLDLALYHYVAVAAYNIGKFREAAKYWSLLLKNDSSKIAEFYLNELESNPVPERKILSYHYHLPFEEHFRLMEAANGEEQDNLKRDPFVRSSLFWALRHGETSTKLKVIQALSSMVDDEVEYALREFILDRREDEYLKKLALFVLRSRGVKEPIIADLGGEQHSFCAAPFSPHLPEWHNKWQYVMELALREMDQRYEMVEKYDLETLWVEFLSRVYPQTPKISKVEGWAAALEYLTAKMHSRAISYHEVARRYEVSITTVSKNVKRIDQVCGLKEKMDAVFYQLQNTRQ